MNEWKKLYEIENWRDKQGIIKHKDHDGSLTTLMLQESRKHYMLISSDFDKPVWCEIKPELPSYADWYKHYAAPTRKDLLHRYIEHLAGIVGKGGFVILYDTDKKEFVPVYSSTMLSSESRFISGKAAQRVINHANKELKELYGVKKNDN